MPTDNAERIKELERKLEKMRNAPGYAATAKDVEAEIARLKAEEE